MWYAIIGLGILTIITLARISILGCDVDTIKNTRCDIHSGCEEYIKSVMREYDCFNNDTRRYVITEEAKMQARHLEEICNIRSNLEKQIRCNERYDIFNGRDVSIREALQMLFGYLKLAIKPGDDIKIVRVK